MKEFVQVAKTRTWFFPGLSLFIGPDVLYDLTHTIRVFGDLSRSTIIDSTALKMADLVYRDEMPAEVFLDWLKDNGHLEF